MHPAKIILISELMEKMAIEIKSLRGWVHLEIGPQAYEVLDPIFAEGFVQARDPIGL